MPNVSSLALDESQLLHNKVQIERGRVEMARFALVLQRILKRKGKSLRGWVCFASELRDCVTCQHPLSWFSQATLCLSPLSCGLGPLRPTAALFPSWVFSHPLSNIFSPESCTLLILQLLVSPRVNSLGT